MAPHVRGQPKLQLRAQSIFAPPTRTTNDANGVSGADMVDMMHATLTQDLKLSNFAATKVLAARDSYLYM